MKTLRLNLPEKEYDITIGNGLIGKANEYMDLNRSVFIVTDSGVPAEYSEKVKNSCKRATVFTVAEGEESKSLATLEKLLCAMLEFGMNRGDCVVAVGGGVVGDLAGFAASVYMRGVDFYNIPTTLLSQVDSSIGGKTAVNLGTVKNIVGAFHQPKAVLIDTEVLRTLPKRQVASGLAEAVKMSLTSDKELFEFFETEEVNEDNIEWVITRALAIKKAVVEEDEKETGLRKILNFGHTIGHGIEALEELSGLYHGECVALGMIPMCQGELRNRLIRVLEKLGLPTEYKGDIEKAIEFTAHDKKSTEGGVSAIFVDTPGSFRIEKITKEEFGGLAKKAFADN